MKKVILTLGMCLLISSVFAQMTEDQRTLGTTNKKGQYILPQKGDIAIGIDATSMLRFVGNSFNGNSNNNNTNFFWYEGGVFDQPAVFGKYFVTDTKAIRGKLNLGLGSKSDNVQANGDRVKTQQTSIGLSGGYEFRRGYGRLQAFAGPEVGLGFSGSKVTTTIAGTSTEVKNPNQFIVRAGGFLGVEYFILPKIAVGGEMGAAFEFTSVGKAKNDGTVTADSYSNFSVGIGYTGSVTVAFYF